VGVNCPPPPPSMTIVEPCGGQLPPPIISPPSLQKVGDYWEFDTYSVTMQYTKTLLFLRCLQRLSSLSDYWGSCKPPTIPLPCLGEGGEWGSGVQHSQMRKEMTLTITSFIAMCQSSSTSAQEREAIST